jgi:hypothetical protein
MSDPLDPCRSCFWSAELTRATERIWCSHRIHHGWAVGAPRCAGKAWRTDAGRSAASKPTPQAAAAD